MEELILKTIAENPELVNAAAIAVSGLVVHFLSSVVTMVTRTKTKSKTWNAISAVLNLVALNAFRNKNADAEVKK